VRVCPCFAGRLSSIPLRHTEIVTPCSAAYPFPVFTTGNNFLPLPPVNATDPITYSHYWNNSARVFSSHRCAFVSMQCLIVTGFQSNQYLLYHALGNRLRVMRLVVTCKTTYSLDVIAPGNADYRNGPPGIEVLKEIHQSSTTFRMPSTYYEFWLRQDKVAVFPLPESRRPYVHVRSPLYLFIL
jgi:hypothetical protein